ncbi:hypothetical protein [Massilia litorea]|uniref:hypothetical protein n=1 Tax=Massilia litorea TaxID=2769491 RepID=UPI001D0D4247|nr:hypothetical protein [Massilia litorea]
MPELKARLPGQALRLGVGDDSLALVRTSRLFGARRELVAEARVDVHQPAALAQGLRTLLGGAGCAGWPLSVVLADELARMWQVTPPPQAASPADLEAAAAMRFTSLFGAAPGGWTLAADWQASQPFLAAAVPAPLLESLALAAREARCPLVEVVPQFVAAMNGWRRLRRPGAWFGLVHGQVLTLAAYDGRVLVALRTAVVPPGADRAWLDGHVGRDALRLGLAAPKLLQLCGAAPRAWAGAGKQFACILLDDGTAGEAGAVRLACTGSAA